LRLLKHLDAKHDAIRVALQLADFVGKRSSDPLNQTADRFVFRHSNDCEITLSSG
jgi:hypothetical protein